MWRYFTVAVTLVNALSAIWIASPLKEIPVRPLSINALSPILVTDAGMVIEVNPPHQLKAPSSITARPSERTTSSKLPNMVENAYFSMVFTFPGMVTFFRLRVSANAPSLMATTPSDTVYSMSVF